MESRLKLRLAASSSAEDARWRDVTSQQWPRAGLHHPERPPDAGLSLRIKRRRNGAFCSFQRRTTRALLGSADGRTGSIEEPEAEELEGEEGARVGAEEAGLIGYRLPDYPTTKPVSLAPSTLAQREGGREGGREGELQTIGLPDEEAEDEGIDDLGLLLLDILDKDEDNCDQDGDHRRDEAEDRLVAHIATAGEQHHHGRGAQTDRGPLDGRGFGGVLGRRHVLLHLLPHCVVAIGKCEQRGEKAAPHTKVACGGGGGGRRRRPGQGGAGGWGGPSRGKPLVVAVNGSMKVHTPAPTPHHRTMKSAINCCRVTAVSFTLKSSLDMGSGFSLRSSSAPRENTRPTEPTATAYLSGRAVVTGECRAAAQARMGARRALSRHYSRLV
eukprot:scaffold2802_cov110-Isochrysis_galbana.AAC.1